MSFEIHDENGRLVTWTHLDMSHAQTIKRELNTYDSRYIGVRLTIKPTPRGL